MSIAVVKLAILLFLNIIAIINFVGRKVRKGASYIKALNMTWNQVILNQMRNDEKIDRWEAWCPIIHRMWWFTIFYALFLWLTNEAMVFTSIMIGIIFLHGYWWLQGNVKEPNSYNRMITLNLNWGIVFRQVEVNSFLKNKTLAELDLRKKNLLVLAIERESQTFVFPKGLETLEIGDRLVMFGDLNCYRSLFESA